MEFERGAGEHETDITNAPQVVQHCNIMKEGQISQVLGDIFGRAARVLKVVRSNLIHAAILSSN